MSTSLNSPSGFILGHIDILQYRNSKFYIMDYKPEATKEHPIGQLFIYACAFHRKASPRKGKAAPNPCPNRTWHKPLADNVHAKQYKFSMQNSFQRHRAWAVSCFIPKDLIKKYIFI